MLTKLAKQPLDEQTQKSKVIAEKLFSIPLFLRARSVAYYSAIPGEVQTHPMILQSLKNGRRVMLPCVDAVKKELVFREITDLKKDLTKGVLGILEPKQSLPTIEASSIECVIVPALAFDGFGFRLGRGAGYYDRFLKRLSPGTAKIGVGYAFQMVKKIPQEAHDEKLDWVVTD